MKYINPKSSKKGDQLLKEVYQEIKSSLPGPIAPPYKIHSIDSKLLSIYWDINKFTYFSGDLSRTLKDVVAAGVSDANECPFCYESHTELLQFENKELKQAFRTKNLDLIKDPYTKKLAKYSLNIYNPNILKNESLGYNQEDKTEIIGTVLMFTYTNILTNIFLYESVIPLPNRFGLRNLMWKMATPMMKKAFNIKLERVDKEEYNELPNTLEWADQDLLIGNSFNNLYEYLEKESSFLSDSTKEIALQKINSWNGESLGLQLNATIAQWLKECETKDKDVLNIIYKSCFASYTMGEKDINSFLSNHNESQLLIVVSWSAAQICQRISSWL
ncbi:hypothetical protein [uncultured Algibacter sp.]|uniref:hypothetical protein n=1 Tax=uncultured Algibacter sp. TaxID=298659 RepID=UPI002601F889|nr:hypothetical protein [uncultured Algibacter sp.]